MPLPTALARFNRVATNRLLRPLASILPSFGIIVHRGRVSGEEYQTMVNWWRDDETAIIALTYGTEVDWLKNLRADGGGMIRNRGKSYLVGAPVMIGEEGMRRMPAPARFVLSIINVDRFVVMPLIKPGRPT